MGIRGSRLVFRLRYGTINTNVGNEIDSVIARRTYLASILLQLQCPKPMQKPTHEQIGVVYGESYMTHRRTISVHMRDCLSVCMPNCCCASYAFTYTAFVSFRHCIDVDVAKNQLLHHAGVALACGYHQRCHLVPECDVTVLQGIFNTVS